MIVRTPQPETKLSPLQNTELLALHGSARAANLSARIHTELGNPNLSFFFHHTAAELSCANGLSNATKHLEQDIGKTIDGQSVASLYERAVCGHNADAALTLAKAYESKAAKPSYSKMFLLYSLALTHDDKTKASSARNKVCQLLSRAGVHHPILENGIVYETFDGGDMRLPSQTVTNTRRLLRNTM